MTGYKHLCETYAAAERAHPDLMEPYAGLLADAENADERMRVMWRGLRETIALRVPMAEAHSVGAEPERQGALGL